MHPPAALFFLITICHLTEARVSLGLLKKESKEPKPSGYGIRPRGVPLSRSAFYATGDKFTCIDNSKTIPFGQVNDDYCDCPDGSDEPGTSACTNAKFHCMNRGHQSLDIPSSRVNDQICDCCDGSDEWDSAVNCQNICEELGAKHREELKQKTLLAQKGYVIRQQMAKEGQQMKDEKLKDLEKLKEEMKLMKDIKEKAEAIKNDSEKKEREAVEAHRSAWEEVRKARERERATELFSKLDVDGDQKIQLNEWKSFKEFGSDENGEVTDEDIKIYYDKTEACELEYFISDVYKKIRKLFEKAKVSETDKVSPGKAIEKAEEEKEKTDKQPKTVLPTTESDLEETMPPYDEGTQALIEESNRARDEYLNISSRLSDIEESISEADSYAKGDYGADFAWAPLKGKCFNLDENQYVYSLCIFEKATQKDKSGIHDVELGVWNSWAGELNKYDVQKYDKGSQCWNGPERSTMVTVVCGEETALVEADEPAKCEYRFVLRTPAACPDPSTLTDVHEEL